MGQAELPDEALMQQVARDHVPAFDALLLRHQAASYRFALRLTGDAGLAEDLTQEAFLRVWRARHGYQPTAPFRTWLLTIVRRLVLDEAKKRHVPTERLTEARACDLAAADSVPQQADARALERLLNEAIVSLPRGLREVVLLRDVEGLRYDQIAQITGRPVGTVKSRLNSVRTRLRAMVRLWIEE